MLHEDKELCFRDEVTIYALQKSVFFSGGDDSANSAASLLTRRNFCPLNYTKHCMFETIISEI